MNISDIDTLQSKQSLYHPDTSIQAALSSKVTTAVIGPTLSGKSTMINQALSCMPEWAIVGSTITRELRDSDPASYHHITLEAMAHHINHGDVVNYSIIYTGDSRIPATIYATLPEDFPAAYNLFPVLTTSLSALKRAGLRKLNEVSIVLPADEYADRLNKSLSTRDNSRSRLLEAITSLTYSIQHQYELHFIENSNRTGGLDTAVNELIELTSTGELTIDDSEKERRITLAHQMLELAQAMYEKTT